MIKRLVAVEYEVTEETETLPAGMKYTLLVDPDTGKYYEPVPGWEVTGEDLSTMFVEYPREVDTDTG